MHNMEVISDIFQVCAVLHNMNHEFDGYDDWEMDDMDEQDSKEAKRRHTRERNAERNKNNNINNDEAIDIDTEEEKSFAGRRNNLIDHYIYLRSRGLDLRMLDNNII